MNKHSTPLLSIENFQLTFTTPSGDIPAIRRINLDLMPGQSLAIVGESGAGKSQLANAIMGLLPKNAMTSGDIYFSGKSLLPLSRTELNHIRGHKIAMIFQDPMTALNPLLKIGIQLTETLQVHLNYSRQQAKHASIDMLTRVQLQNPEHVLEQYPHQLSGGMRQRVVIAMALLCQPDLIIADEPTTALDVTVQTDILRLLASIQQAFQTSLLFITHDLPIVSSLCDHIAVMYAGQVIEYAETSQVLRQPKHPYTQGLMASMPQQQHHQTLYSMPGSPPAPHELNQYCAFLPRCTKASHQCHRSPPVWQDYSAHQYGALCWHVET